LHLGSINNFALFFGLITDARLGAEDRSLSMNHYKNWLRSTNGRVSSLAALTMSLLILLSGIWGIVALSQQTIKLATQEARDNWEKDQSFRGWATRHGGVYVKPDARTPPNPYLSQLPNRDVVTTDGMKLTLMSPADMMSQLTREFEAMYGIKGSLTGQILTNPENAPDDWELKSLKLFDKGTPEFIEQTEIDGEPYIRFMRPMIMTEGCMKCHSHLGFKVGDIRGGVSVSIPLSKYFSTAKISRDRLLLSHGILWIIGLTTIAFVSRYAYKLEAAKKSAAKTAEQARLRLTEIIDIAPEAIITIGSDSKIQLFNQGAERIFGYKAEEALGQSIAILMPDRFRKNHHGLVANFEKGPENYRLMDSRKDVIGLRKNQTEFLASASVSKNKTDDETLFTVMLRDITDSHAADIARRKALNEAEKANKAKSQFMASMSHELRTPLNSILGFAEMISKQVLGPIGENRYRGYAEDISFSGKHLLDLVNQILDIERIEAGKYILDKEPVLLTELFGECERLLKNKATENYISLTFQPADKLPPIHVDRRAIFQVLINIVTNALKFTPANGAVHIHAEQKAMQTIIKIADTGIGIPKSKLATVAEPFTRHRQNPMQAQEGVGLGLAIASALVELHGGTLDIQSSVGKGTQITIALPESETSASAA